MVGLIESLIRFDIRKVRYQDSIIELTKRLLKVAFVTQMTLTLIVTFKVKPVSCHCFCNVFSKKI